MPRGIGAGAIAVLVGGGTLGADAACPRRVVETPVAHIAPSLALVVADAGASALRIPRQETPRAITIPHVSLTS
jgi:hypothetical protein